MSSRDDSVLVFTLGELRQADDEHHAAQGVLYGSLLALFVGSVLLALVQGVVATSVCGSWVAVCAVVALLSVVKIRRCYAMFRQAAGCGWVRRTFGWVYEPNVHK